MSVTFTEDSSVFTCDHCLAEGLTPNLSGRLPEGWSQAYIETTKITTLETSFPHVVVKTYCSTCAQNLNPEWFILDVTRFPAVEPEGE